MSLKSPELKENLHILIDKLEVLKSQAYKSDFQFSGILGSFTDKELEIFSDFADLNSFSTKRGEDVISSINSVIHEINEIPEVVISLPFEPSHDFKRIIVEGLGDIYGLNISVGIKVTPEIVGGIIIEYQGVYLDHSIKNVVHKLLVGEER